MMQKLISILSILAIVFAAVNLQACDAVQQMIQGTPTPTATITYTPTLTPTITPTVTLTPTITPSPTVTPNLAATQQYETFLSKLQKYVDAKFISSTNGKYQSLGDHSFSLANPKHYQWEMNGVEAKNFIVQSDVTIQTVNPTTLRSGCGFTFPAMEPGYQITLFLGQDGTAYMILSSLEYLSRKYKTIPNPAEVELTLIVSRDTARLLVNDREMIKWAPLQGVATDWGYAVISGSDEDYGTKCEFKNVEYWVIED